MEYKRVHKLLKKSNSSKAIAFTVKNRFVYL